MFTAWPPCEDGAVGPTVLIVDDHADFRAFARTLLEAGGFEVVGEARDGASALAAARALKPGLVLLDIQLPDIDGYEATRRIKARPALQHIPIVVVTSYALSGDDVKARAAGADGYVTKPFSPRALLATVRGFLPPPPGAPPPRSP